MEGGASAGQRCARAVPELLERRQHDLRGRAAATVFGMGQVPSTPRLGRARVERYGGAPETRTDARAFASRSSPWSIRAPNSGAMIFSASSGGHSAGLPA
jgi:hypothetical protein